MNIFRAVLKPMFSNSLNLALAVNNEMRYCFIMIEKNFLTIHPGEILEEEFLKPIQRNLQSKMEI
jgi:hypothetical protein